MQSQPNTEARNISKINTQITNRFFDSYQGRLLNPYIIYDEDEPDKAIASSPSTLFNLSPNPLEISNDICLFPQEQVTTLM